MKLSGYMLNDGVKVTFYELLSKIPYNHDNWYIFEFDAIGIAPGNMTMQEFEDLVLNAEYGYRMDWEELFILSKAINDINNLILISSTIPINFVSVEKGVEYVMIRLEIHDSTYWEIEFY
ncbi:hypothetical protein [Streptococcus cuniculi]|uniref:Uncharacterized protein n=1 Tax=Streptococcus cuniculi TaxID=1432788 RepID=A0A4Y9JAA9_9STRE|nr:hypothetical protein [Streptococcus cuniculi]MBF0778964.1 hypothetical protein [Streptococcus cuniculi]TFU97118.1 hypothetical protein E4T82_09560 [Streptococcus cuniculi]